MVRFKGKWFWTPGLAAAVLAGALWVIGGCSGKIPPIAAVLAPSSPPLAADFISDFENKKPNVNPNLLGGSSNNAWRDATFGGPAVSPNAVNSVIVVPNTVPDATNSSKYAIHVFAPLIAAGTGCGYESDQLVCPLYHGDTNTYFDASAFTGIQFMLNISPADTNTAPVVQVAIAQTEPPPALSGAAGGACIQGPCGSSCFNHFQYSLPANPGVGTGGWITVSLTWSQFNSPFSAPPNPLSSYLNKIIFLQWTFSDNAPSGITTNTDFWVDNVQFLP